jgi:peptidoglycan/xylan/chitin deacetylase (PgdA/CDA1 family)
MTPVAPLSRVEAGLLRLAGNLVAALTAGNRRLCILNYHRVLETVDPLVTDEPDVATFRWQMQLLAQCFNVLPLSEALAALDAGTLPARAVCITFDDGYRSTHDLALPILREFGLPASVFVSSGFINSGNMWNDQILETVRSLHQVTLDLSEFGLPSQSLGSVHERKVAIDSLTEHAKYLPPNRRHDLLVKLMTLAGDGMRDELMLTPDMVCNLIRNNVEIGAHTVTHPILALLDDEAARSEIELSKRQLEDITSRPVTLFAYPNGKVGLDFDHRHVAMAQQAGFVAAFTTGFGAATRKHDRFQIPRSRPWDKTPLMFTLRLVRWLGG